MQAHETRSLAESLALLPESERSRILSDLTEEQAESLQWDWSFWGRPDQQAPPGQWVTWLILTGRGWGKTRTGAEWVRDMVCGPTPLAKGRACRIALVAETAADARHVMVEGPGGLINVHPRDFRPSYEPSNRRLVWPNGAIAMTFNAVEPDQLRGPQHDLAWCDELAKWRYARDTWDMLQFGLRLGDSPQQIITTTPKPIQVLKEIIADPDTVVTRGSTYDNKANLAPSFFKKVVRKYEGTRLGRQELNAELLEEAEGALWSREIIERNRVTVDKDFKKPGEEIGHDEAIRRAMKRIVVAMDPAVTSDEDSSEHGLMVCGLGHDDHGYVIEDLSERLSPDAIARKAIAAYDRWDADRIVGEVNNGGDWIGHTIAATAKAMHTEKIRTSPEVAYTEVRASRGKQTRAEPISALDEQNRIHHIGGFSELEDQLCEWEPLAGVKSPDRLDARVWGLTELMLQGADTFGYAEREIIIEPIKIPKHWAKVYALDMDGSRVSCLWGAHDRDADTIYFYDEYVTGRTELAIAADTVRKKGSWIPGLFDHLARGRSKPEGQRITEALVDLKLDIFTVQCDPEAGAAEVSRRLSTKRIKVFSTLPEWLHQYRAYRRNKDGDLVEESDGLMKCTGLLAISGTSIATYDGETLKEAQDEWADASRSSTGY